MDPYGLVELVIQATQLKYSYASDMETIAQNQIDTI